MWHYLSIQRIQNAHTHWSMNTGTTDRFEFKDTFIPLPLQPLSLLAHLLYLRLHTWIEIPNISPRLTIAVPYRIRAPRLFFFGFLFFSLDVQKIRGSSFSKHQTNRNTIYIIGFTPERRKLIKAEKTTTISVSKFTELLFGYPLLSFYRQNRNGTRTEKKRLYKQCVAMLNHGSNFFF